VSNTERKRVRRKSTRSHLKVVDSEVYELIFVFISQLSSLYEVKPPISKAKMNNLTKTAIKAIKFYKHVVQSVEKFIQKVGVFGPVFDKWTHTIISMFFLSVQNGVQDSWIVCNRQHRETVKTPVWR
jgi:hypothetical protein